jgi:DNA polymerase-3 subunit gamma/tau
LSTQRLLDAIHLFNAAATDLKSGLETIPHLPLEMALIESAPRPPALPGKDEGTPPPPARPVEPEPTALASPPPQAGPPVRTLAGPTVLYQSSPPPVASPEPIAEQPAEAAPPPVGTGSLTLGQVQQAWGEVLQAVRKRNPATQGVLNTGCQPVDVVRDEVVIAFPYPFMREKLDDPQRKQEVQEALDSVLGVRCRLRLVLATEYTPTPRPATPSLGDQEIDEISRWAAERGGQTTILRS